MSRDASASAAPASRRLLRDPALWQLPLVLATSALFEASFRSRWLNKLDEGWPLYAAMRLHAGGTLYDDVFWVFPPGHVLGAWLGFAIDPPGILAARTVYAAFTVALCGALYLLGRRLMPAPFALLGALLVAIAAPRSHQWHVLFGYRYLVLTVVPLLLLDLRLRTRETRWLWLAGAFTGLALCFRLTPAFAASCGIGLALLAADPVPARWLRDGSAFAAGLLLAAAPVAIWLAATAGLDSVWTDVVLRPLSMLQAAPWPPLALPETWSREALTDLVVALQFRLWWLLYAGYAIALLGLWVRSRRRGERFAHALLLAVVVWGAIYFTRSLGRSDEPHLDSAIPPVCLLVAHLLSVVLRPLAHRAVPMTVLVLLCLGGSVFLERTDHYLWPGRFVFVDADSIEPGLRLEPTEGWMWATRAHRLRLSTQPGDTILVMDHAPVYHVLSGRLGPGHQDVIMPGTFRSEEEEARFLDRVRAAPPAAVVWPEAPLDEKPEWAVERTAPRLAAWVRAHYAPVGAGAYRQLLVPRPRAFEADGR